MTGAADSVRVAVVWVPKETQLIRLMARDRIDETTALARIAAQSGVMTDIPAGESYGGSPAIPVRDWHRRTIALDRLSKKRPE